MPSGRKSWPTGAVSVGPADFDLPQITAGGAPLPCPFTQRELAISRASVSSAFWDTVAEHVTAKVEPALRLPQHAREPGIASLREREAIARRECDSREAIQIIASGRHLLGDRSELSAEDGPFSKT